MKSTKILKAFCAAAMLSAVTAAFVMECVAFQRGVGFEKSARIVSADSCNTTSTAVERQNNVFMVTIIP